MRLQEHLPKVQLHGNTLQVMTGTRYNLNQLESKRRESMPGCRDNQHYTSQQSNSNNNGGGGGGGGGGNSNNSNTSNHHQGNNGGGNNNNHGLRLHFLSSCDIYPISVFNALNHPCSLSPTLISPYYHPYHLHTHSPTHMPLHIAN